MRSGGRFAASFLSVRKAIWEVLLLSLTKLETNIPSSHPFSRREKGMHFPLPLGEGSRVRANSTRISRL
jgi:hypothetical protein